MMTDLHPHPTLLDAIIAGVCVCISVCGSMCVCVCLCACVWRHTHTHMAVMAKFHDLLHWYWIAWNLEISSNEACCSSYALHNLFSCSSELTQPLETKSIGPNFKHKLAHDTRVIIFFAHIDTRLARSKLSPATASASLSNAPSGPSPKMNRTWPRCAIRFHKHEMNTHAKQAIDVAPYNTRSIRVWFNAVWGKPSIL